MVKRNTLPKPIKIRKTWVINPRTRVKKSQKIYKRQKLKKELRELLFNNSK